MSIAIAVDGPAGAGKSTIAKILSKKFNLNYIDTGSMYRGVTLLAQRNGISADDVEGLCSLIKSSQFYFFKDRLIINEEDVSEEIRNPNISNKVSFYAAVPEVRELLVEIQKNISKKYDVIMDGRDIGTVVLPQANVKFYVTASPEVRAQRRYKELIGKKLDVEYDNILQEIIKRDYIDSNRKANPLKKAEDAIEIDTSSCTIEEVVEKMAYYIENSIDVVGD
ncbi:(d)CMP kinase [Clostridium sp. MSJ-11]|uniref:Cytidylate kinase n=1 Tax=Clostridium mobile TaxID=2841512 RepID=A0ABS6ECB4_9CLOT|nr:(d)CMP kinase [Clostridium mobile]MBU5482824.1 (d)CMP kinase [Clostridium mobile]